MAHQCIRVFWLCAGASQRTGLPSSFVLSAAIVDSLLCVRDGCACEHLRASGSAALPQGPSLRSGLCCPGPSSLNRPHPPHTPPQRWTEVPKPNLVGATREQDGVGTL